jgi:potassium efflux system protein
VESTIKHSLNLQSLLLTITLAGSLLFFSPAIYAQKSLSSGEELVSAEVTKLRIQEVQDDTSLEEDTKNILLQLYRSTLTNIELTRTHSATTNSYIDAGKSAPAQTEALREKLEKAANNPEEIKTRVTADMSSREIDQVLNKELANQAAVSALLTTLDQQQAAETGRPGIVQKRLVEASQLIGKIAADMKMPPAPDELPSITQARYWALNSQSAAVRAEIRMLDQELLSQTARVDLLRVQSDETVGVLRRIDDRVAALNELLKNKRRSETEELIASTDSSSLMKEDHELAQAYIEKNIALSKQLNDLTDRLERISKEQSIAKDTLKLVEKEYKLTEQRIEIAGLNQVLGQFLHEQRRDLADPKGLERKSRKREQLIIDAGLTDIQYENEWRALQDTANFLNELMADLPADEQADIRETMQILVQDRRTLLKNAIDANSNYLRALAELDFQEQQLEEVIKQFNAFLAERLIWVRSEEIFSIKSFTVLPKQIVSFLASDSWPGSVRILATQAKTSPVLAITIMALIFLMVKSRAIRLALKNTGTHVGSVSNDKFTYTIKAFGLGLLLTLPLPLLTGVLGTEINRYIETDSAGLSIGQTLILLTPALFFLRSIRVICIDGGLAEKHFLWPAKVTNALRRDIDKLLVTFILPAAIVLITSFDNPHNSGSELARFAFVLASIGLILFFIGLLKPDTGTLLILHRQRDQPSKIRNLLLAVAVAIPAGLSIASLAGFLYSSIEILGHIIDSLWLIFILIFLHELTARWLLMARRKLSYKMALEKFETDRLARESNDNESADDGLRPPPTEDDIDVASLDADTRKLIDTGLVVLGFIGLSGIWSEILPALSILREITLWQQVSGLPGAEKLVPVTLAEAGLSLLYIFATYIAARSLPALLDVFLRHQSKLSSGSRLAFATLTRYGIVVTGLILVISTIGFNWSKIQWLVAALGVGIGFGLQEIVANFISGLIILMEQPVRVGDIVTVGDASGTVTKIQIRATTVTNWNRQELLVPNKEFITGRVLNWSLTDEVIRLVVKVGVAYGSDVQKALTLMKEATEEHERILNEPKPLITFDEFGDSALILTLRCYIGTLNKRRETISELNMAIDKKFKQSGIVIAFPQRDIHINTANPLDVRINKEG